MFSKIRMFFLFPYLNSSLDIRIKTRILLDVGLLLIALTFIPMILLIIQKSLSVDFFVRIISLVLVALSLHLLRKKHYHASSNVIITAAMILLPVFVYVRGFVHYYEMYTVAFFLLFVLIISCLVGYSRFQPVYVMSASVLLAIVSFIIRIIPLSGGKAEKEQISSLFFIIMFEAASGFIGFLLMSNTHSVVKMAEQEAETNLKRFKKLEEVLEASKRGLRVGENLMGASENSIRFVEAVNSNITSLKSEMASLNSEIQAMSSSNSRIASAAQKVAENIRDQGSSVEKGTASIEEMTRSIQAIAGNAKGKDEAIQILVNKAREGESRSNETFHAMEQISRSAEEMMDFISVNIGIAEQTNMLAMNAAIEAAHAGEYGKGFSIVASEIRELSNETDDNTKEITARIQKNSEHILQALDLNSAAQKIFQQLSAEVMDVSRAIQEMTANLREISDGTRDTLEAINTIVRLTGDTDGSMKTVEEMIQNNNHAVEQVNNLSSRIYQNLEAVASEFSSIGKETRLIHEIGLENISNIESMEHEIDQIKTSSV